MNSSSLLRSFLFGALLLALLGGTASADPVDLTDGTLFGPFSPFDPVTVNSPAAGQVTIAEDFFAFIVSWTNDPVGGGLFSPFNAPHTQIVFAGSIVKFSYSFTETIFNDNTFSASVFNANTGIPVPGATFSTSATSAGMVTFDLTGAPAGVYGLTFDLIAGPFDFLFNSTVVISNLDITSPVVPEPGVAVLLLLAVGGVALRRRRRA